MFIFTCELRSTTMSKRTRTRSIVDDEYNGTDDEDFDGEPKPKRRKQNPPKKAQKNSKNSSEDSMILESAMEYIELPPEIIVHIFNLLPGKDLLSASHVCQHWWLCSKDESLHWIPLLNLKLREDPNTYDYAQQTKKAKPFLQGTKLHGSNSIKAHREAHFGKSSGIPAQATLFNETFMSGLNTASSDDVSLCCLLRDSEGNPVAMTRYVDPNGAWVPDLTMDCYRHTVQALANEKSAKFYSLKVEAQPRRIERQVREGIHNHQAVGGFVKRILNHVKKTERIAISDLFDPKDSYNPSALPVLSEQPEQIKGVKLHNYQLNAINWMLETEQNEKKYEISPLFPIQDTTLSVLFEGSKKKFVTNDKAEEYTWHLKPKGGVLADEMGLGKTVEMIGLMLTNPMREAPVTSPYFATKATLVCCPNHLVGQWQSEIEKYSAKKLSIVQLTTINQVKKVSYQQVIDADVVIVSYNLLQNKNYLAFPSDPKALPPVTKISKSTLKRAGIQVGPTMSELLVSQRMERIDALLEELKDNAPNDIKGVILDHFHWHRVVMDEGHETIIDRGINNFMLSRFKKTFTWYMTGTPFPNKESLEAVRIFLGLVPPKPKPEDDYDDDDDYRIAQYKNNFRYGEYNNFCDYNRPSFAKYGNWSSYAGKPLTAVYFDNMLNEMMLENLVWRNTKTSIADEYKMTDTKHECVLLDFSPTESTIYEDITFCSRQRPKPLLWLSKKKEEELKNPLRELCCKLAPEWGKNLTEVAQRMIEKKKRDIRQLQDTISDLKKSKLNYEDLLRTGNTWTQYSAKKSIEDAMAKIEDAEDRIKGHKKIKNKFESLVPADVSQLEKESKECLIESHGTKLGNLVVFLKKLFDKEPTTRVIIFSQFSDYLQTIETLLEEHAISCCTVEGNVYRKTKALQKFKGDESDVKVILLSLSKAASGTNLIEASHVLLMDPLTGTREEAQAYETQAIGRAQRQGQTKPVTVVRFIIKNTIEHEFYLRNTGTKPSKLNRSATLVRSGSFSLNAQDFDDDDSANENDAMSDE